MFEEVTHFQDQYQLCWYNMAPIRGNLLNCQQWDGGSFILSLTIPLIISFQLSVSSYQHVKDKSP